MLTYLSLPVAHPDPARMAEHQAVLWRVMTQWTDQGVTLVSPWLLWPMWSQDRTAKPLQPEGWASWLRYAEQLLERCDHLMVVTVPGWDTSAAVAGDLAAAHARHLTVVFVDPDTLEVIPCPASVPTARHPR